MKTKKQTIITHIIIISAVLGSSEPFDRADISPWVMIVGLALLLVYYFVNKIAKQSYIPKFDILAAFLNILVWVIFALTVDYWSNVTGWDRFIYIVYPPIAGIFFICLLVLNLIVYAIKRIRAK